MAPHGALARQRTRCARGGRRVISLRGQGKPRYLSPFWVVFLHCAETWTNVRTLRIMLTAVETRYLVARFRTPQEGRGPSDGLFSGFAGWAGMLAVAIALSHCAGKSNEDCARTLTCSGTALPYLDSDCSWRRANGSPWLGGPRRNREGVWVWPDGEVSRNQSFVCGQGGDPMADASVPTQRDSGLPRDAGRDAASPLDAGIVPDAGAIQDAGGRARPVAECQSGQQQRCGPTTEVGQCRSGNRDCIEGSWGECLLAVYPAERNCSSVLDHNCDGQPDNLLDSICQCGPGTQELCDEHEGFDGVGSCRAGTRSCRAKDDVLIGGVVSSSVWGECEGAVGPQDSDDCI